MKERPILFSAPMVRALLAGTKTQTRRAVKPPDLARDKVGGPELWTGFMGWQSAAAVLADQSLSANKQTRCPYGMPGDLLWCRESFSGPHHQERHPPRDWHTLDPIHYWADGNPSEGDWTRPRPGMFMPRWASRITLEVTEVRVERLQVISEADAIAEGVYTDPACPAYDGYRALWHQINGAGSWDANPWVWVVLFKVMRESGNG